MPSFRASKVSHIVLWSIAILYLLFSPSLNYHLFTKQEGKPVEVLKVPPKERGKIRYQLEKNLVAYENYEDAETYALKGWAFVIADPHTQQAEYDRFIVVYNESNAYLFLMKVDLRPRVQEVFKNLGLNDLKSSGFEAVISRNALRVGEYKIGLLFRSKEKAISYYKTTNRMLKCTPNYLLLLPKR